MSILGIPVRLSMSKAFDTTDEPSYAVEIVYTARLKSQEVRMFSRIHSTTIAVSDQDAALDFYVNTLGWEKGMDANVGEHMRFLTVLPPGAETQLVLGHESWFAGGPAPSKGGISLVSPDIDATYATLTARGVRFKEPVAMMPWGQKAAWFYDPDDNEFFLVEE